MKTILSQQSAHANGKEIYVIHGQVSEYIGSSEQREAQKLLSPEPNMKRLTLPLNTTCKSVKIYQGSNDFLIFSNFDSTDESGRQISYAFYTNKCTSPALLMGTLEDYCVLANQRLTETDKKYIPKIIKWSRYKYFVYIIIGLLLILLLSIIF